MNLPEHVLEYTRRQKEEVLPGVIRTPEDLFDVPEHIQVQISAELEFEILQQYFRTHGMK